MKSVNLKIKLKPFFHINVFLVRFISALNADKGYIAYDIMLDRLERRPSLFIEIVEDDNDD